MLSMTKRQNLEASMTVQRQTTVLYYFYYNITIFTVLGYLKKRKSQLN